jgi:hypothetical protein
MRVTGCSAPMKAFSFEESNKTRLTSLNYRAIICKRIVAFFGLFVKEFDRDILPIMPF